MAAPGIPIHADEVEAQEWAVGTEIAARRRRLGAAAGASTLGVAIIEIPPGKRPNPPHAHADEEEIFLVLAGSGLSYQRSGSRDIHTYEIGVDDLLVHPSGGAAHTLIAGPEGLTVLVAAEGSRTSASWLPRTRQLWFALGWQPSDTPHPFAADAALDPLEVPDPEPQRPPSICNLAELEVNAGRGGPLAWATRDAPGDRLVFAQDTMPPDSHTTELHWHSAREEAWYVRGGSGWARRGDDVYPLRPGSFWLEPPDGRVGHRIEVGPDGMDLITIGDLVTGDVSVYPERGVAEVASGVEVAWVNPPDLG